MTHAFAATLKRLRESAGLSQSKLADLARFDHSYISRLESAGRVPTRDAVTRIADAMELDGARYESLLHAAGFLNGDDTEVLKDPDLRDLATVLGDEALPAEFRQGLRTQVRALVEGARFVQRLEAA